MSKLAGIVQHPVYLVRHAIVQLEAKNFNEYVNSFRISEVKKMLEDESSNYTIEGMDHDVGFASASSFYEVFKKVTYCTPVEYEKQLIAIR